MIILLSFEIYKIIIKKGFNFKCHQFQSCQRSKKSSKFENKMLSKKLFYFSSVLCSITGRNLIFDDEEPSDFQTFREEWIDYGFKSTNTTDDQNSSRGKRSFHMKMDPGVSVFWPNGLIPFRISRYFDQKMRNNILSAIDYIEKVSRGRDSQHQ